MFAEIRSDLRPRLNQRCVGWFEVGCSEIERKWLAGRKVSTWCNMTTLFGYLKNDLTIDLKLQWIEPEPSQAPVKELMWQSWQ